MNENKAWPFLGVPNLLLNRIWIGQVGFLALLRYGRHIQLYL